MSSERQLLDPKDPWWGEHIHRYNETLSQVRENDIILDLACGTGFGSHILSQHTKNLVIGGDIAEDAIKACRIDWPGQNLRFEVLDGTKLPYENEYFDIIVSFETIEHTTKYMEMLHEFNRVLKPSGVAFISTPNFPVNSPSGKVLNPYHTQEFTYDELEKILTSVFREVKIQGQKYSRYDDNKASGFGKVIYWFFNIIGIRKLPYNIKNAVSRFFTGKSFYPSEQDFTMVGHRDRIVKCKTFFCTCRK